MTIIFIVFLLIVIILLSVVMAVVEKRKGSYDDSYFINEDGDHVYYERSIIRKKDFAKKHPDVKGVRTVKRLFRCKD